MANIIRSTAHMPSGKTSDSSQLSLYAEPGDTIIAVIACRANINGVSGGGGSFSKIYGNTYGMGSSQQLNFYCGYVVESAGTQYINIYYNASNYNYAVCYCLKGPWAVNHRSDMNFSKTTNINSNPITITKPGSNMYLWAVSCDYAINTTTATSVYTANPDDMTRVTSGTSGSSQVQLATWFDDGSAASNHTINYPMTDSRMYAVDGLEIYQGDCYLKEEYYTVYTDYPTMSSNTYTYNGMTWTVTSSGETSGYPAYYAFDQNNVNNSYWKPTSIPCWIRMQLPEAVTVDSYRLESWTNTNYPKTWKFQGSNNGTNWTDLDTQTDFDIGGSAYLADFFTLNSPVTYKYYRLYITAVEGTSCELYDFRFGTYYEEPDVAIYAPRYMVRTNGQLVGSETIPDTELTGEIMVEYGSTSMPDPEYLTAQVGPEVFAWQSYIEMYRDGTWKFTNKAYRTTNWDEYYPVPEMVDYTYTDQESGQVWKVSASSYYDNVDDGGPYYPYYAFDDGQSMWSNGKTGSQFEMPCWLQVELPDAQPVNGYMVAAGSGFLPSSWTFQGSNNGTTWTNIDSVSNFTFEEQTAYFGFEEVSYKYYRLYITAATIAEGAPEEYVAQYKNACCIAEFMLFYSYEFPVYFPELDPPPMFGYQAALPYPQDMVSKDYDMDNYTILGIERVYYEATEGCLYAFSFDSGSTWLMWTGEEWGVLSEPNTGMTGDVMTNITPEQWAMVATTGKYRVRVTIPTEEDSFYGIYVDYINPQEVENA